ncbi:hypothetical protein Q4S45_19760 [Massilia sp. R2A-15]|uniref:arsenate reductase/protein-tyrosine-phosphatase family protein n=1 Tax=Massilia sp. R2A-15 TaxID=3064278 RepID=UPI002734E6A6|nr:hypothetical protein [Massilia sp. R2A-15]WLI88915.1 hypothetical protein Q4S45_19760 [Massilia sp. R2A-15]
MEMVGIHYLAGVPKCHAETGPMKSTQKVLVIGDDSRSFLSTVRSLGRKGIEVHAAPFDFGSAALLSRYIRKVHFVPYYLDGGAEWLATVSQLLRDEQYELVIPCDERALLPLCLHREELGELARLAIPSPTALEMFFDKIKTRELAQSLGVPVAAGRLLNADELAPSVIADIGLPVVVKQPKSYQLPDLYIRSSTSIVRDEPALTACLRKHTNSAEPILLEQMFEGCGVGVSVLCSDGVILQAFEHHRAHELDGSSYYRKSAPLDADRLAAVARMTTAIRYTGLAMFEFKVNVNSRSWILIEVNARPWGSLPLPVSIGIDFPYRLFQLLSEHKESPALNYPIDRYGRNLMLDFWQARLQAELFRGRPTQALAHWGSWLWGFRRLLTGRERHDSCVLDDYRPGVKEVCDLFAGRAKSLRMRVTGKRAPTGTLAQRLRALAASPQASITILFVCQGNINRSSYAEIRARQLFADNAGRFTFTSAGMLPRNRRPSSPEAVKIAAKHGVDMVRHQSRHATRASLDQADLVIAFDETNLRYITARYPDLATQICLLSELDPRQGAATVIADPEGSSVAVFDAVFQTIDTCLLELARIAQPVERAP